MHRHINPLAGVSRNGPLIAGSTARRVPRILYVVQVCEIAGAATDKFCGDRAVGLQCSVAEKILFDGSRLGGEDGCEISSAISGGVEPLLDLRHGLLGGADGKLLGHGLCTVVARGGLLQAGGGEKRNRYCREQQNHEQCDNERRGVFCIFWEIGFQNVERG